MERYSVLLRIQSECRKCKPENSEYGHFSLSVSNAYKKLHNLVLEDRYDCHDPDKVIFNYSSSKLSNLEKRLLAQGLNYALPPLKLNYDDYVAPFELFYSEIKKLLIEDHELEKLKTGYKGSIFVV